jgi:hypothetical protein
MALIGAAQSVPKAECQLMPRPCKNGARCIDNQLEGGFTCACAVPWVGTLCDVLGDDAAQAANSAAAAVADQPRTQLTVSIAWQAPSHSRPSAQTPLT